MKKKWLALLLLPTFLLGCEKPGESSEALSSSAESLSSEEALSSGEESESSEDVSSVEEVENLREARFCSSDPTPPDNLSHEDEFPAIDPSLILSEGDDYYLALPSFSLHFVKGEEGYDLAYEREEGAFYVTNPAQLHFRYTHSSGGKKTEARAVSYSAVEPKDYGFLATANLEAPAGSSLLIEDKYYLPEGEEAINLERNITVLEFAKKDIGFEEIYAIRTALDAEDPLEYFIPNCVFGTFQNPSDSQHYNYWRETVLGIPLAMMRDVNNGLAISLGRYRPVIDYSTDAYAALSIHNGETSNGLSASSIELTYPSRDTARHYMTLAEEGHYTHTLSIALEKTSNYEEAMISSYNRQYALNDPRIVDTDIDEVYRVINEDFKSTIRPLTNNGITSYGVPCEISIEDGSLGSKSYQAGFTGQQIPCAYHMLNYGAMNKDAVAIQNGINVLNFWVKDAGMMTPAGVPQIWFEGGYCEWMGYPTFLRMAIDAMEGLLDAYRVATANDLGQSEDREAWREAFLDAADWLVTAQNSDGSWYRTYNYEGTMYRGDADRNQGITWNPGDALTAPSTKDNSTMPVRFLAKIYQMTGEEKYKEACLRAGEFIMENLYPRHYYKGGTCDNPNSIDREAGVFAMYAFDSLYMLTGEERYLSALREATTFTMSSVITTSWHVRPDTLKASRAVQWGYTDGLSYITANGTAVDNFAAFIYYELFRTYIMTGESVYLDMAEFIQQNTKSTVDWDGTIGYKYRSLTPEASTIWDFSFRSVGFWLPWQSDANAEPIAKMYDHFGTADVGAFRDSDLATLRESLNAFGYGGGAHRVY